MKIFMNRLRNKRPSSSGLRCCNGRSKPIFPFFKDRDIYLTPPTPIGCGFQKSRLPISDRLAMRHGILDLAPRRTADINTDIQNVDLVAKVDLALVEFVKSDLLGAVVPYAFSVPRLDLRTCLKTRRGTMEGICFWVCFS
jgi:hypothetical protein